MRRNKGNRKKLIMLLSIFIVLLMISSTVSISAGELASAREEDIKVKSSESEASSVSRENVLEKELPEKEEVKSFVKSEEQKISDVKKEEKTEPEISEKVEKEKPLESEASEEKEDPVIPPIPSDEKEKSKKEVIKESSNSEISIDEKLISNDEKLRYVKEKISNYLTSINGKEINGVKILVEKSDIFSQNLVNELSSNGYLEQTYIELQPGYETSGLLSCLILARILGIPPWLYCLLKSAPVENSIEGSECELCSTEDSSIVSTSSFKSYSSKSDILSLILSNQQLINSMSNSELVSILNQIGQQYGSSTQIKTAFLVANEDIVQSISNNILSEGTFNGLSSDIIQQLITSIISYLPSEEITQDDVIIAIQNAVQSLNLGSLQNSGESINTGVLTGNAIAGGAMPLGGTDCMDSAKDAFKWLTEEAWQDYLETFCEYNEGPLGNGFYLPDDERFIENFADFMVAIQDNPSLYDGFQMFVEGCPLFDWTDIEAGLYGALDNINQNMGELDWDGDGIPNYLEDDLDNDGIPNNGADYDGDGEFDGEGTDYDGDGEFTGEGNDINNDGDYDDEGEYPPDIPPDIPPDEDDDGDGIPDGDDSLLYGTKDDVPGISLIGWGSSGFLDVVCPNAASATASTLAATIISTTATSTTTTTQTTTTSTMNTMNMDTAVDMTQNTVESGTLDL